MTDTDTATTPVTPLRSGELTYWMAAHSAPGNGGRVSWYPVDPKEGVRDWWIGERDDYWARTVENARLAYGDPNIRYNTNDVDQDRYLVFGDGTHLPKDGTVLYRNTNIQQNFVRNTDGSISRQDFSGKPIGAPMAPVGYTPIGGQYAPVDAHGNQIAPLVPELPGGAENYRGDSLNGIWTPRSDNGDYYTVNPNGGSVSYFDRDGKPIDEQRYRAEAPPAGPGDAQASSCGGGCQSGGGPHGSDPTGGEGAALESTPVVTPEGMRPIDYPLWAKEVDPDIPNQMTAVVARLYELFGSGSPTQSDLPDFPFNTADGAKSGIDAYDSVKAKFIDIEQRFQAAAQAYRDAVANSAFTTTAGRQAINTAIDRFNTSWQTLPEADWAGLLTLESQMLDNIQGEVMKAAGRVEPIPPNPDPAPLPGPGPGDNPDPGPPEDVLPEPAPPAPPAPPAGPPEDEDDGRSNPIGRAEWQEILEKINQANPPAAPAANPLGALGGMNPLGGLGGMNPLGGLGGMNPLGGLGSLGGLGGPSGGVSPLPDAAGAVRPLEAIPPENQRVTPVDPVTPAPVGPVSPGPLAAEAPEPPFVPAEPVIEPAGLGGESPPDNKSVEPSAASGKPTVTLPDGKVIEAADPQAAKAAQAALDNAGPGGDAAQKAYSQAGLELPSDGKNPGAKVDPSDMQPGDILKWQDKTMVAVAPGLVADPTQPGVTRTLQEVLANPQGFQGMFRPTDIDPTLSAPDSSPPRNAPPSPPPVPPPSPALPDSAPPPAAAPPSPAPGETIPLAGTAAPAAPAAAGQSAPPSPFESQSPPPPVRTTKADRIASGEE
jgi:hypothetical protein